MDGHSGQLVTYVLRAPWTCLPRDLFYCFLIILLCSCFNDVTAVPPSFIRTSRPVQTVRFGNSLFLQCKAKGNPHPVVTWMKDGSVITSEKGVEIDEGELKIQSLKRKDSGRYICRAHSLEGTKQHVINVYVSAPPEIKRVPQDARVTEGQDVTFSCNAVGYPPDIKYRWCHNGQPVSQFYAARDRYSILNGETLVIRNVSISDKGQVTCEASNGYGSPPSVSANLVVEYTARVTGMPKMVFGGVSRCVKLYCPSVANPPVNRVEWKKNGIDVQVRQNPRYTTDGNGSLIIYAARHEDRGRYTCVPYNLIGTEGPGSTILQIRDLPHFVIKPASRYSIKVGTSLKVPCSGSGNPPPGVSWRKLKNIPTELVYCVEGGNLTIDAARKEHHGVWQCVLTSPVGHVTTDVMLVVEHTSPHKAENVTAAVIETSSIRVKWDPGYDGGFPQHFVVWYKKMQQTDHAWRKMYVPQSRKVAVVKNLMSNTAYQISIKSENQRGGGPFSETLTVKTKEIAPRTTPSPPLPIPTPTALSHATTEDGLIKLTWQPLCCSTQDILGFLVEYRRLGEASSPGIEPLMTRSQKTKREVRNKRTVADEPMKLETVRHRRSSEVDSSWVLLDKTFKNQTSYELQRHQLYRDQIYEFQVLAVTTTQYGQPSPAVKVSTAGLTVYPLLKEPITTTAAFRNPVTIGILSGVILICILVAIVVTLYCRRRTLHQRNTKESLQDSSNDNGAAGLRHSSTRSNANPPLRGATTTVKGSSSLKRRDYVRVELSPEGKDFEKNLKNIIQDYENEEGKGLLCRTCPSSTEFGANKPTKGGTSDDGSVKKRREIAAKVLWAQKSERQKLVSGLRRTDSFPPRPASATPYHSRDHETTRHQSWNDARYNDAPCPVSLEDRRRKDPAERHVDPVYLVVQEERKKRRPTSFTAVSQRGHNDGQTDFNNFSDGTRDNSLTKSAFSPFYSLASEQNNAMASCCVGGCVTGPTLPHQRQPSSFLVNDSSFCCPDTTMTSSGYQKRPISATLEQASFLRSPRSRASYSYDNRKEARHSLHTNNADAMLHQPTFEIDCSNSDVMLRLVDDRPMKNNGSGGKKTNPFKVGPNSLEEANQINVNTQPSPVKVQLRPNHYTKNTPEQRKHASMEALFSPTLTTPVFNSQVGYWAESSSPIAASSKRNSRNDLTKKSSLERRKKQFSFPQPLGNKDFKNHSYLCQEDFSSKNATPVSVVVIASESSQRSLLHNKENSDGPLSDGGEIQMTKPTLISLSDVSWSPTRFQSGSGRASSQMSPVSPYGSPYKSTRGQLYQSLHSNSVKTSLRKEYCGSLERPFKLKNLSLPPNNQDKISFFSNKKSRSFGSLRSSSNIYSPEGRVTRSVPGVRSLPVSPIKKFPSNFTKTIPKDKSPHHYQYPTGLPTLTLATSGSKAAFSEETTSTSYIGSPVFFRRHQTHDESTSSGYVTQDASLTSPGFGNLSTGDRARKDNSSVEDNYEWDSAFAVESEILDALKQFNNLNKTSPMSDTLRDELTKFAMDQKRTQVAYSDGSSPNNAYPPFFQENSEYSKESIEKRCAALREEFLNYQRSQEAADVKRIENETLEHDKSPIR